MSNFWKNKTIWLVGASDGIGAALAAYLLDEECTLILSARNEVKLNAIANGSTEKKAKIVVKPLDLTDKKSYQDAYAALKAENLDIDVLILMAGMAHKSRAVETTEEVDRQIMEVNFMSLVQLTKMVLPNMLETKNGHIAVISSILGEIGLPLVSTYAASKHALNGYFNSLRYEVEDKNIDVTIVSPGFIQTDITKKSLKGDGSVYNEDSEAQQKGMDPKDCAAGIKKAIEKKKQFVYVGGVETNMPRVARLTPRLFQKLMRKLHKI